MAMGTRRKRQRQEELWCRRDLAEAPGDPFYRRLNEVLDQAGFDEFCEARCHKFYHEKLARPSLRPDLVGIQSPSVTARSRLPSPLKSPVTIASGPRPVA
jgi:hypothetical protein